MEHLNSPSYSETNDILFVGINHPRLLLLYPLRYFTQYSVNSSTTARITNLQQLTTNLSGHCQQQCPAFFKDESARASMFREILHDSHFEAFETKVEGTKFKTDGDIQSLGFRRAIIEIKNEIGSGRAQPRAQR